MITNDELVGVFFKKDALNEMYEFDSTLLEVLEEDLDLYLNEIDEKFVTEDKTNVHFNLGFMYSANSDTDVDKEKFYGLIDTLKDNDLIPYKIYDDFSRGYNEHQDNYYIKLEDIENEGIEVLSYNIERALITRYCTNNINALL